VALPRSEATGDTHIDNVGCVAAAFVADLRESLAGTRVARGDEVGLSVDFKESEAFALFGLWRLLGLRNSEPRATDAERAVIAGELSLPPGGG
jgi:1,6-anhydro-N-acetylmuramate kinase